MDRDSRLGISVDLGENDREPPEFLDCIILSDKLGYDVAWLGDHFMPWVDSGGRSLYTWPLMGAALQATRQIKVGSLVATPIGGRYHPAILAQAAATLDNLFPGRLLVAVGTGEAVNESNFMTYWPKWEERIERLSEGVVLMKKLWTSLDYFDFNGNYFKMKQLFLYTKPRTNLEVYYSGVGRGSARHAGKYGDHLITLTSINRLERCRDLIFPSFDQGAREAGKDPKKMQKVVSLGFTFEDSETYLKNARKTAATNSWNETDPRVIENMGEKIPEEKVMSLTYLLSGWDEVIDLISKFQEAGATHIILQSGANQETLKEYANRILPHFR